MKPAAGSQAVPRRGKPGRAARDRVALEFGVDLGALESDLRFAEAVEVVARNCGVGALALMLKTDNCLEVSEVLKIGRKGPERQRYEMVRAAAYAERPPERPLQDGAARRGRLADGHAGLREGPGPDRPRPG